MENLVSHEAMVKEIKNLCWDNRYREGMTVEHLAEELDALAEDFDPYEYRDNLLDEDNYIDEIIYDLNDGRYINEYMECSYHKNLSEAITLKTPTLKKS